MWPSLNSGTQGGGWRLREDGSIELVMFVKEPKEAPKEVRDITHICKDKKCKDSSKGQCLSVGVTCTEGCSCSDCTNVSHDDDDDDDDVDK